MATSVETETKKVLIQRRRRVNNDQKNDQTTTTTTLESVELEYQVLNYGDAMIIEDTDLVISVAVARFILKNEDRFCILRLPDNDQFGKYYKEWIWMEKRSNLLLMNICFSSSHTTTLVEQCQRQLQLCHPLMVGFIGVFDGHDGDLASEYCSKGLVPHVLAEFYARSSNDSIKTTEGNESERQTNRLLFEKEKDLTVAFVGAFQKAQTRFQQNIIPPSFEEVCNDSPLKIRRDGANEILEWICSGEETPPRGGTTACTLSIVS